MLLFKWWISDPKKSLYSFPGGLVVKDPPANAGDTSSIHPWSGKIPHGMGQISLCAKITEHAL